ncbi:hypothetical protein M0R45_004367 [Rubus argutus]|uniref:Ubiquitin-like domain-containing protein n=1 Tax=Rubus argutus TaxID=59490 RepID=A0AAW1YJJ2_RUBAR
MALSFLVGYIWVALCFIAGSVWSALSFVAGLVWAALPFFLVSGLVVYAGFLIWGEYLELLLTTLKTNPKGPLIRIDVSYGSACHELIVPAFSTFGDVKKSFAKRTGLEPGKQRLLFGGKEKKDEEHLHKAGVIDESKVYYKMAEEMVLGIEAALSKWYSHVKGIMVQEAAQAMDALEAIYLWARQNPERYEQIGLGGILFSGRIGLGGAFFSSRIGLGGAFFYTRIGLAGVSTFASFCFGCINEAEKKGRTKRRRGVKSTDRIDGGELGTGLVNWDLWLRCLVDLVVHGGFSIGC